MIQIRCSECGCALQECQKSPSPKDCPNCRKDECGLWHEFHSNTKPSSRNKQSYSDITTEVCNNCRVVFPIEYDECPVCFTSRI